MRTKIASHLKRPYSELSGYTIAKNCTDRTDIEHGLSELKKFIKDNYPANCKLAYKRINALNKKLKSKSV